MPIQPNFLEPFIPGLTANTGLASGNITQQLSGMPSTSNARKKAAYFGATSGMPNSGVSNAFGYDLYNQEAEAYKQLGFDNLLKMLTGYSGTAAPTPGQIQQGNQFNQEFNERRRQTDLARQDAQNQLNSQRRPNIPNGTYRKFGDSGAYGVSNLPVWNPAWDF